MSNSVKNFPIEGTAALRVEEGAVERTQIIAFPGHERRPLHAKPETPAAEGSMRGFLAGKLASAMEQSEMVSSLRHGTCKGKAVGRMTSLQAAGASLFFFVFLMGTLLFV